MRKTIGLIVNPVAVMGGIAGLKGTDGEMFKKSLELGANPITPARTKDFLTHIKNKKNHNLCSASKNGRGEWVYRVIQR